MQKLIRITTVPLSLEKLLEGQLTFMSQYFEVVAVSSDHKRLKKFGKENGVGTYHVKMTREITPLSDLKALFKLYKFFRKEKPLIVHTHTPKAGILGMLAAKMARVPVRLHTVAGMPLLEATGLKREILDRVEKMTYSCATKIYPNSFGLEQIIISNGFAANGKVKVLGKGSSNGIDTSYFDPEIYSGTERNKLREKIGIPLSDQVFIFVGRLVADKGINELVKAFAELQKSNNNCSLLMVGPLEQELDALEQKTLEMIEEHPKIFSVGYQVDVRPYFAVSDVLSFPSYREGFPNVVMQAGAMGLASIVTNINGCNEIITEGINGSIIPVRNKEALKMAMKRMLDEPDWRKQMQENAREKITSQFEQKEIWKLLLEEYKFLEKKYGLA